MQVTASVVCCQQFAAVPFIRVVADATAREMMMMLMLMLIGAGGSSLPTRWKQLCCSGRVHLPSNSQANEWISILAFASTPLLTSWFILFVADLFVRKTTLVGISGVAVSCWAAERWPFERRDAVCRFAGVRILSPKLTGYSILPDCLPLRPPFLAANKLAVCCDAGSLVVVLAAVSTLANFAAIFGWILQAESEQENLSLFQQCLDRCVLGCRATSVFGALY